MLFSPLDAALFCHAPCRRCHDIAAATIADEIRCRADAAAAAIVITPAAAMLPPDIFFAARLISPAPYAIFHAMPLPLRCSLAAATA